MAICNLSNRETLILALAFMKIPYAWKSRTYADESDTGDFFFVGAPAPTGMIMFTCSNEYWHLFKIPVIPHIPDYYIKEEEILEILEKYLNSTDISLVNSNNIDDIERMVDKYIIPTFHEDSIKIAAFIGFYNH